MAKRSTRPVKEPAPTPQVDNLEDVDEDTTPKGELPTTCINCGQGTTPIQRTPVGFKCLVCRHVWGDLDEMAPFRQNR